MPYVHPQTRLMRYRYPILIEGNNHTQYRCGAIVIACDVSEPSIAQLGIVLPFYTNCMRRSYRHLALASAVGSIRRGLDDDWRCFLTLERAQAIEYEQTVQGFVDIHAMGTVKI